MHPRLRKRPEKEVATRVNRKSKRLELLESVLPVGDGYRGLKIVCVLLRR